MRNLHPLSQLIKAQLVDTVLSETGREHFKRKITFGLRQKRGSELKQSVCRFSQAFLRLTPYTYIKPTVTSGTLIQNWPADRGTDVAQLSTEQKPFQSACNNPSIPPVLECKGTVVQPDLNKTRKHMNLNQEILKSTLHAPQYQRFS